MQKKYIGLILGILIFVLFASGCINSNMTGNMSGNTYSGDGVSFNIPANWHVSEMGDGLNANILIDKNGSTDNTRITVVVSPNPEGMSDLTMIIEIQNPANPSGWQKISNSTLTVDGNTAYETTYLVNDSSQFTEIMKEQQIYFIKNGNLYGLIFTAPEKNFDQEKPNLDITLNSFKIL